jgi:hypothetical protein
LGEGRWSRSMVVESGDQMYVRTMDNGDSDGLNEAAGKRSRSKWKRITMVMKPRGRRSWSSVSGV